MGRRSPDGPQRNPGMIDPDLFATTMSLTPGSRRSRLYGPASPFAFAILQTQSVLRTCIRATRYKQFERE